jgi:hypothetical protein
VLHLLYRFSKPACNRCRRIKPTPTADYANNTNAGTATASYTFAGDDNHTGSNDSQDFSIGKASSTTVVTTGAPYYIYSTNPATVSVTGAGGLNPHRLIMQTIQWNSHFLHFAGDDNHTGSNDSQDFSIVKHHQQQ